MQTTYLKRSQLAWCFTLFSITCFVIIGKYWIFKTTTTPGTTWRLSVANDTQVKTAGRNCILLYNNYLPEFVSGIDVHDFRTCKSSNCRLSTDNSDFKTSKAVIFHHFTIPTIPPPKQRSQLWVFTTREPPTKTDKTYRLPLWKNRFDLVMNYRRDSDFVFGYGDIIVKKQRTPKDFNKIYDEKDSEVAWIVSHCSTYSRRELYVQEMRRYINVDILGACGNLTGCLDFGKVEDHCRNKVGRKYKFYLSFENSLCKGYTTEKLFYWFVDDKNIIPVVRGAFDSKDYLPKDALIFTEDFTNPKDLALYLKELGSNKRKYIDFLRRKDRYTSRTFLDLLYESMCDVCNRIDNTRDGEHQSLNLEDWMQRQKCREPVDIQ